MTKNILIGVTNIDTLSGEPNGTYFPELTHALHEMVKAGFSFALVSPKGGKAPIYGEDPKDPATAEMLKNETFVRQLAETAPIDSVNPDDFDAVFYPGGYGLLFDLVEDAKFAAAAAKIYEKGGVLSAVCHGPAALSEVTVNGAPLVKGQLVTGFTREEEVDFGTIDKVPYLVSGRLMEKGARYAKVSNWQEHVITEDRIITGQNPASAGGVGAALVARLTR